MAKPPKDKPVYAFIRRGEALVPEMEWDRRALEGNSPRKAPRGEAQGICPAAEAAPEPRL